MSWIFTIENRVVKPQLETLLIEPFKEIWHRDLGEGKPKAMKEFAYIEFMVSVKQSNPYAGYPVAERAVRICKDVMEDENYIPDNIVKQAIDWLENHQKESSPTLTYYLSALKAANKIKDFFDTFDMNEKNTKSGALIYTPKMITSAIIDTETALQKIVAIREKVYNEVFETIKTKGQKKISLFADPNSL